jgi:hypothetical protein
MATQVREGRQTNTTVARAEAWRLSHSVRLLVAFGVCVAIGVLGVVGTFELVGALSQGEIDVPRGSLAVSSGAFLVAASFGVVTIITMSREIADGTVSTMLRFVPNRLRALIARSLALTAISLAAALVWAFASLAYVGLRGGLAADGASVPASLVGSVVAVVLSVLVVNLIAVTVQNGVLSLLMTGLLFLVLPLIVSPIGVLGRLGLAQVGNVIFNVLPGTFATNLMSPSLDRPEVVVGSLFGLLVWVGVAGYAAYLRFEKIT